MAKDLAWAAKMLLSLANVPVKKEYIDAFLNYNENKMWVKGVIKAASPAASTMSNPYYFQAMQILQANGISDSIYDTGS
jgi:hypothetical protein